MKRKYAFGASAILLILQSGICLTQVLPNPKCFDEIRTTGWCDGAKFCVIRYYFSKSDNRCKPFAFHSEKEAESDNIFKSSKACAEECPPVDPDLLTTTRPPKTLPTLPPTTTVPETTTTTKAMGDPCLIEPDSGPCMGNMTRWYYSLETSRCEPFKYGGCHGNANNFGSFKECQYSCPKVKNECVAPVLAEPCKGRTYHWYYNVTALECQQYEHTECAVSYNRFRSKRECQNTCNECDMPPDSGGCRGFFRNWYYNSKSGKCEVFIYGGCFGNFNRFETASDCLRDCI